MSNSPPYKQQYGSVANYYTELVNYSIVLGFNHLQYINLKITFGRSLSKATGQIVTSGRWSHIVLIALHPTETSFDNEQVLTTLFKTQLWLSAPPTVL